MIRITGMAHVGVRVTSFDRTIRFYKRLGFTVIRDDKEERVIVLKHPNGIEINLLDSVDHINNGRNVLMDEPVHYPGYTHLAMSVTDVYRAVETVKNLGIKITEGPVTFGDGSTSIFFRDPDLNVIELSQPRQTIGSQPSALKG